MAGVKYQGVCKLCGKSFSKGSMARHLQSCREKASAGKAPAKSKRRIKTLHIVVEGSPYHWLHVEASAEATLDDLDAILRNTWLECCGHASDFEIEGERYSHAADMGWGDADEADMNVPLGQVLQQGVTFSHTYDYGSTTCLQLRVASEGEAAVAKRSIQIQARNEAPEFSCAGCGAPATCICTECVENGSDGLLCDRCLAKHECGDEAALPVVDSPRMGVCGYTGP